MLFISSLGQILETSLKLRIMGVNFRDSLLSIKKQDSGTPCEVTDFAVTRKWKLLSVNVCECNFYCDGSFELILGWDKCMNILNNYAKKLIMPGNK